MTRDATGSVLLAPQEEMLRADSALVDVVDRLLDRGCVIQGELWLSVADVDLVFVGLKLVLTSPDRVTQTERAHPA